MFCAAIPVQLIVMMQMGQKCTLCFLDVVSCLRWNLEASNSIGEGDSFSAIHRGSGQVGQSALGVWQIGWRSCFLFLKISFNHIFPGANEAADQFY